MPARPVSAPCVKKRVAYGVEPYLDALQPSVVGSGSGNAAIQSLQARVQHAKRQLLDFQDPTTPRKLAISMSAPHIQPCASKDIAGGGLQGNLDPLAGPSRAKKSLRPRSCGIRRPTTAGTTPGAQTPLVKHPMRLIAAKLNASLDCHDEEEGKRRTTELFHDFQGDSWPFLGATSNQNETKRSHAYYSDVYHQVALQLDQNPASQGLADVLRRIWTEYVDPLHDQVEKFKRLGLDYVESSRSAAIRPTTLARVQSKAATALARVNSAENSKPVAVESTSNCQTPSLAAPTPSLEAPPPPRSRRLSQAALTFGFVDQIDDVRKVLEAKVKALRQELISMQRLRESIFTTVMNADVNRQKEADAKLLVRFKAHSFDGNMLKRLSSAATPAMQSAAIQIQKVARGKLATKRIRYARLVALMRLTKEVFHHKLRKQEWTEFDAATMSPPPSMEALEEEMKAIVWQVTQLVRDLSLDWWKLSLSEERARLTWEVNDLKDELKLLQQNASILAQNCRFSIDIITAPYLTKAHDQRLGVHQYYPPSPRPVETPKEMLDFVQSTNNELELFIFALAKAKQQRISVQIQTEAHLAKQPTYLQALALLARQESKQSPQAAHVLANIPDAMDVATQTQLQDDNDKDKKHKKGKGSPKKHAAAHRQHHGQQQQQHFHGLKDVPVQFQDLFKVVGKVQSYKPRCMGLAQLKLLLHEISTARMADDLRPPLGVFLYRFFARKYGLRPVAETHLVNLFTSLKTFLVDDIEIRLFARVCQLRQVPPLSLDAFDYYVSLLASLGATHRNEVAIPIWYLPHVIRQAVDLIHTFEPGCMLELIQYSPEYTYKDLEAALNRLPHVATDREIGFNAPSVSYVDRNEVLGVCLDAFEAIERSIHDHLITAFQVADIDQNGELSFSEFNSLVQKVYSVPEAHVQRMFFDAIAMSGDPIRDAILPQVFVVIAKKEGLSRKSYVQERRNALTAPPVDTASLLAMFEAAHGQTG
ncbi:unnamed protein product [Aphanomyces euteiches]|uniref:EF-hand domain-containing protein n=1 Tax=Aphanomyces euteiches TaxID=100861 RepID=A0A6G0WRG6_9STRA|nr:hypothetical protein Ae201684_012485 [Aphanomyces euteiches]